MVASKQGPLRQGRVLPVMPDDETIPQPVPRAAQQRIRGDAVSDEIIAQSVKRAEAGKARAQTVRREKITPKRRQTHAVHEQDVHENNESARQLDSRTEVERDSEVPTSWRLPGRLDAPPPRPGYQHRWIRYRNGNEEDAEHFDEALEEGWRPVKRSRVRQVHELTDTTHGKYGQYYVKRGLILCEIPETLEIQRQRYFKQQQADQNRGVDRNLYKVNHRVMPMLQPERRTQVTTRARRGRLEDAVPGDEAMGDDE